MGKVDDGMWMWTSSCPGAVGICLLGMPLE